MRSHARTLTLAAAAMLAGVRIANAADHGDHVAGGMVTVPDEKAVKWAPAPPSLPRGMELAVLYGDPAKPGPFTLRVRMPPNTVIAPHTHATDENLTVLTGTITHDMGDKIDKARGTFVETGGFVYLPGNMPHSLWNGSAVTVLQVTGTGPFGLSYVDPADDPGRKAAAQ